jgi:hypothetical protein
MDPQKKRKGSRVKTKEAQNLQVVKALMESRTPGEAYQKLHPNCTAESAAKNAKRMLTPEVMDEFKQLLAIDKLTIVNRENLEKMLMLVLVGWTQGKEKTQDYLKALDILTKLSPDFAQKYENLSDDDVTKKLKELGWNPNEGS